MRRWIVVACLLVAPAARADGLDLKAITSKLVELTAGVGEGDIPLENVTPPRFAFTSKAPVVSPKAIEDSATMLSDYASRDGTPVVGKSADGKSAWVATDIIYVFPCGMEGCDKMVAPQVHASALMDATNHAVAWHVGVVVLAATKRPAPKRSKPLAPAVLATGIDAGADEVATVFKTSIADPKAFAKTISDRKDAVLLGSELPERYVGGAAMRATVLKWNLGFKVRDGIQAGLAPSKTTAWVAANVDAAKPGDKKSTPYRVLAIYDKQGGSWQLVLVHFSTVTKEDQS